MNTRVAGHSEHGAAPHSQIQDVTKPRFSVGVATAEPKVWIAPGLSACTHSATSSRRCGANQFANLAHLPPFHDAVELLAQGTGQFTQLLTVPTLPAIKP